MKQKKLENLVEKIVELKKSNGIIGGGCSCQPSKAGKFGGYLKNWLLKTEQKMWIE